MPRRRSHVVRNVLLAVLLAIVLFMGVVPLIELRLAPDAAVSGWLEWTRSRLMEILVSVWFFALGSMVGSFVNVVVWRMPRGVSVVSRGSACPWCTAKIRLVDNIPVFGWIKLGGRCRVCRLPISPRYPLVEALFGAVFLLLFFVELQTGAANLPGGSRYRITGILQIVVHTRWDVIAIYGYHLTLLVMLMIWALMAWDRSRLPVKTIVFALLTGYLVAVALPDVQPVQWFESLVGSGGGSGDQVAWFSDLPLIQRSATGFLGLTAGFLAGSFAELLPGPDQAVVEKRPRSGAHGVSPGLTATGLFLGWQAVGTVVLMWGLLVLARQLIAARPPQAFLSRMPAAGDLVIAVLLQLCLWSWLDSLASGLGGDYRWAIYLAAAGAGLALVGVSRLVRAEGPPPPDGEVEAGPRSAE